VAVLGLESSFISTSPFPSSCIGAAEVEGRPRPALDTGLAGGAALEAGLDVGAAFDAGLGAAFEAGLEEAVC
jgi:hypothetical protein